MFVRFDSIHERVGLADRRTPHDGIGRACIALRGKNGDIILSPDFFHSLRIAFLLSQISTCFVAQ